MPERVTIVGRALRRSRLDELPQLYIWLATCRSSDRARCSLIDQPIGHSARQLVRPGLTGWAQVMGGRHVSAEDKVALDLWYLNASLALDLRILMRTVPMLIAGEQINSQSIDNAWSELETSRVFGQEPRRQVAASLLSDKSSPRLRA